MVLDSFKIEKNIVVKKYSWFMQLLLSFDQLGNVLAGGYHDSTVSARIGYQVHHKDGQKSMYWKIMEMYVDLTFRPIDGKNHCLMAYCNDKDELNRAGNFLNKIILSVLVVLVCSLAIIPIIIISFLPGAKTKYYINGSRLKTSFLSIKNIKKAQNSDQEPCDFIHLEIEKSSW